jgi:SAM-dependent methyltransferase
LSNDKWKKIILGMDKREVRTTSARAIAIKHLREVRTTGEIIKILEEAEEDLSKQEKEDREKREDFIKIIKRAGVENAEKITDFHCGTGDNYFALRLRLSYNGEYHGINGSLNDIKNFKDRGSKTKLFLHHVEVMDKRSEIPTEAVGADIVFCEKVMHETRNPKDLLYILKKMNFVLKPGGRLILAVYSAEAINRALELEDRKTRKKLDKKRIIEKKAGGSIFVGVFKKKAGAKRGDVYAKGGSYYTKEEIGKNLIMSNFKKIYEEPLKIDDKRVTKRIFKLIGNKATDDNIEEMKGEIYAWYIVAQKI